MILKVRNWEKFQHYKDRRPPWIKLHFALLSSKDWVMLSDSERVLAIACMLVASQSDLDPGHFDADPEYIKRVAYLNSAPDFKPLLDHGFLKVIEADDSECKRMLADARPETEAETEAKKEQGAKNAPDRFPEFWETYPKKRKKAEARKKWKARKLDAIADRIIEDVKKRQREDNRWLEGYAPDPTAYINGERWEDEIEPPKGKGQAEPNPPSRRALN